MLKIMVTTYNGQPPERPIVAEFDERGGKIGRASDNTLTLPDVQRYISRTHAVVFFRAGLYLIKDVGTASPVFVNDCQLGTGQEAPIGDGDEIRIAGFSMRVVAEQSERPPGSPTDEWAAAASATANDDPLAAFGAGVSHGDAFADLIPPRQIPAATGSSAPGPGKADTRRPASNRPPLAASPVPTNSVPSPIPEDFDPFADSTPAPPLEPSRLPDDFDLGLGPAGNNQKIDDLFGLASGEGRDPFKTDAPLAEHFDAGGNSASLDPLVAMGMAPAVKPTVFPPQRDNVPELSGSYRFPQATFDGPAVGPQTDRDSDPFTSDRARTAANEKRAYVPPAGHDAAATPTESFSGPTSEASPTEVRGSSVAVGPPSVPDPGVAPDTPARKSDPPSPAINVAQGPLREQPPAARLANQKTTDELLRAYLQGAGVPEVQIPGGLTPELMHLFGQLLRESTQGTIDLLLARATAKRQLRAELTMIVARENNPLKFSPTVEGAMTHLLSPQGRGFMTPLRAIRDAYNDLRSHEVGFIAGMRAALAGVLARFSPAELEKRLTTKTVLDSLLPMNRQAKLWALFEELYTDISAEAEDNFQSLFGREFMRAYEQQIANLEQEERTLKG